MAIFKICTDEIPGRKIFPNLKKNTNGCFKAQQSTCQVLNVAIFLKKWSEEINFLRLIITFCIQYIIDHWMEDYIFITMSAIQTWGSHYLEYTIHISLNVVLDFQLNISRWSINKFNLNLYVSVDLFFLPCIYSIINFCY